MLHWQVTVAALALAGASERNAMYGSMASKSVTTLGFSSTWAPGTRVRTQRA